MGLLDKFRGKQKESPHENRAPCTHTRLVPHWANLQDMGEREKVTHYQCEACRVEIGREDGQALMRADRENSDRRRPS